MIGPIYARPFAANPSLALPILYAYINSPSTVKIVDLPEQCGRWEITSVQLKVVYPDNSINVSTCKKVGNDFIGTIPAAHNMYGEVKQGLTILANGIDEQGNPISGYVLGVGNIVVLDKEIQAERVITDNIIFTHLSVENENPTNIWFSNVKTYTDNVLSVNDSVYKNGFTIFKNIEKVSFPKMEYAGLSAFMEGFQNLENLSEIDFSSLKIANNDAFNKAFYGCSSIVSVNFPELISVGSNAFYYGFQTTNNTNITSISFPKLQYGAADQYTGYSFYYAFQNCSSLVKAEFPELISVGNTCFRYAFSNCKSLTSIEFPKLQGGGSNIFYNAFQNCSSLVSVNFPELISTNNDGFNQSFVGCTTLKNTMTALNCFPKLIEVGSNSFDYTFKDFIGLISGEFPELLKTYMNQTFYGCTSLSSMHFPKLQIAYLTSTFQNCSNLVSVEFPELTSGNFLTAFSGCKMLSAVKFPKLLSSNGGFAGAFQNCENLPYVDFPALTSVNTKAFNLAFSTGCSSFVSASFPALASVPASAFMQFYSGNNQVSVAMSSVQSINANAFYNSGIKVLDFRGSQVIPSLANQNAFNSNSGLSIIVPDNLFQTWKTSSNWKNIAVTWVSASQVS